MISHTTVQEHIQHLEWTGSHEEQLYLMLQEFTKLFPVKNAYLYRYSPLGYLAEGMFAHTPSGLMHIGQFRDDIRASQVVYTAIRERKAQYTSGVDYLTQTSSKYTMGTGSLIIVPICVRASAIGYICSTEFAHETVIDDSLLSSLTLFGRMMGNILDSSRMHEVAIPLSKRELEVMKKVAAGDSTKQMAAAMRISEATANQYIKSAIKKLGAKNRAHAVALLLGSETAF